MLQTTTYPFSSGELTPALGFIVFTRFYQMMIGLREQVYDGNWFKTYLRCWLRSETKTRGSNHTGVGAEGNKWFLRGWFLSIRGDTVTAGNRLLIYVICCNRVVTIMWVKIIRFEGDCLWSGSGEALGRYLWMFFQIH